MRLPHHPADQALLWNQPEWSAPENLTLAAPWAAGAEGTIPAEYRGRLFGTNVSPALSWSGVPEDAKGLVLVCQDPDTPGRGAATHLVATLDPSLTQLDAGALTKGAARPGIVLGRGTMKSGWAGPLPPKGHGVHRYVFQLFAVAQPLTLASGFRLRDVRREPLPLLGRARLTGLYQNS